MWIGGISLLSPWILFLIGKIQYKIELPEAISEYYHITEGPAGSGVGPMRDLFVGLLFAVGALLVAYKGYTKFENWSLNLAGVAAAGVALFPMTWKVGDVVYFQGIELALGPLRPSLHGTCAIVLFACLIAVCFYEAWRAKEAPDNLQGYTPLYILAAIFMALSLLVVLAIKIQTDFPRHVFWFEVAGLTSFAFYWFVKNREMKGKQVPIQVRFLRVERELVNLATGIEKNVVLPVAKTFGPK